MAGKYYYLEAAQKGVDSSDSLSVGVKLPTGRYQRPINKENLQWRLPGMFTLSILGNNAQVDCSHNFVLKLTKYLNKTSTSVLHFFSLKLATFIPRKIHLQATFQACYSD